MTSNRIREIALAHFAKNGYEGASLADISAEVGIKKQSIYNHFKGKDELFLTVFRDAAEREMLFIEGYLQQSGSLPLEEMLHGFLHSYSRRYEQEDDTRFFLRMAFFPPAHLREEIVEYSNRHLDRIGLLLQAHFESAAQGGIIHPEVTAATASVAFIAVLDGMFVELLYGNTESAAHRLDASWRVYWRGIRNN
ncbi:TetR/AcrR family transcriptional regulator [Paenibacillus sp. FSL R7-0331]|uniref:TetR/AcrR family transcriptional regulator n=1 Tax=Paenibacillus sp. FSL R7-0331 TaxID=1536773 RepID=UPI0004F59502|nr:TetR/AcrR family transcriptional regulator [Paenibacillus sp. FSL R7-0331]AIQ51560.1 TetR family transcriptional regulator [Paenibacillus sp. FSL R7-0331]